MTEPIFLNPNSYDNIKLILNELKKMLGIGEKRQWSYVGCDGPPYVIASRLVDEGNYEWVALSNGLVHLYMNQQKTLFNIARDLILEPLAKEVLNFDNPNALLYFFKCTDTHKTNQSLEIFLYGTALEMVFNYITNTSDEPTVEGFLEWNPNNTYHLIRQLVFTYALAIIVNKLGDQNNNEKIQNAGRYKFMELFYAFNHPIYQEIEYRDLKQKVVMPDEVRNQRRSNLTYTLSDNPGKHQGGDFILEGNVAFFILTRWFTKFTKSYKGG